MKIAVSGAAGFIGRHVVAELLRHPVDVVAMSRKPVAADPSHPGVTRVQLDIGSPPDDVFGRLGRPDCLIHLAWGGLPNYRSLHHFEHELPSQYRFLSALVRAGLPALVVAGTCFEYGMLSGPLCETMVPRPDNPYGLAKDVLRSQLQHLQAQTPFALAWGRLFYLHGEGQPQSSLLPQLQSAVQRGDAAFNMSGGEQLRDYLPVGEVARSLVALALAKADCGIVNISSGRPVSVRHFVEAWIERRGWTIPLNLGHYPYPSYEPMAFWGDRAKLDRVIGYPPGPHGLDAPAGSTPIA